MTKTNPLIRGFKCVFPSLTIVIHSKLKLFAVCLSICWFTGCAVDNQMWPTWAWVTLRNNAGAEQVVSFTCFSNGLVYVLVSCLYTQKQEIFELVSPLSHTSSEEHSSQFVLSLIHWPFSLVCSQFLPMLTKIIFQAALGKQHRVVLLLAGSLQPHCRCQACLLYFYTLLLVSSRWENST